MLTAPPPGPALGLTELGRCLLAVPRPFFQWTLDNAASIKASRMAFDTRAAALGHKLIT